MRSLPIFLAWVSTWRYRERRAATPTPTRLFSTRVSSSGCNIEVIVPTLSSYRSGNRFPQHILLDPVHRQPAAVELDHREPLAVAPLELGHAGDVDLVHLEGELGPQPGELL